MVFSEMMVIAESSKFHVSNVTLYEYLDRARADWYRYCISIGVEGVLVHISADFKKEIFPLDELHIRTWLERVGNTSFTLRQSVKNNHDELVAAAEVVMATINRQERTKTVVPEELRRLLTKGIPLPIETETKS